MKRRSFLAMLGLAPLGAIAAEQPIPKTFGMRVQASESNAASVIELKDGVAYLRATYIRDIEAATGPNSTIVKRMDAYPGDLVAEINASTDALLKGFESVHG